MVSTGQRSHCRFDRWSFIVVLTCMGNAPTGQSNSVFMALITDLWVPYWSNWILGVQANKEGGKRGEGGGQRGVDRDRQCEKEREEEREGDRETELED